MSDYKVTDSELTAVANAIRTKGGTNENLEWYSGFVSAIEAISVSSNSSGFTGNNREYLFRVNFSGVVGYIHISRSGDITTSDSLNTPIEGEFITVQNDGSVIASQACTAVVCSEQLMGSTNTYSANSSYPSMSSYMQIIIAWETGTSVIGTHELTFSWGYSHTRSYQRVLIKSDGSFISYVSGSVIGDVFNWSGYDGAYLTTVNGYDDNVILCSQNRVLDLHKISGDVIDLCYDGMYVAISYER